MLATVRYLVHRPKFTVPVHCRTERVRKILRQGVRRSASHLIRHGTSMTRDRYNKEVVQPELLQKGAFTTRNCLVSFCNHRNIHNNVGRSRASADPSGIATTSDGAKSFVSRLVMQTIVEVLEQQGRSAGLPDAIISSILNQLMVQIKYDPLECKTVTVNPKQMKCFPNAMMPLPHCIVIDNTVTALCTGTGNGVPEKCKIEGT
ncbi:hypothetical protein KIN20_005127 [Parelaphostrongylus tenuis]|uniref:Uncharacterized protein n=1 Tax=Parelaphostrongylus tenuis TaxID=148309 RepID=A0AAD5M2R5_PARTN|nr:hypothetical protein KIN20_005127 [Parelaphostrongylus tenuis]